MLHTVRNQRSMFKCVKRSQSYSVLMRARITIVAIIRTAEFLGDVITESDCTLKANGWQTWVYQDLFLYFAIQSTLVILLMSFQISPSRCNEVINLTLIVTIRRVASRIKVLFFSQPCFQTSGDELRNGYLLLDDTIIFCVQDKSKIFNNDVRSTLSRCFYVVFYLCIHNILNILFRGGGGLSFITNILDITFINFSNIIFAIFR